MKRHNDSPHAPERGELERQVESLRRDIRQLQLEHDIREKTSLAGVALTYARREADSVDVAQRVFARQCGPRNPADTLCARSLSDGSFSLDLTLR
ncbi:hypothetical protein [Paraburkholderia sp. Cpub6]|uniref:hypothetical protein n=1 Tax=Paraburkholderia sp. Cpub6 TaxID=2723094 RepID=UPI0016162B58|nr:hypothetical protein [Paraburkholderia sp. Cpub6]MBB5460448.1 hypothetical protein [Paraburkholderia sp. Cpub6]